MTFDLLQIPSLAGPSPLTASGAELQQDQMTPPGHAPGDHAAQPTDRPASHLGIRPVVTTPTSK